MPNRFWFRQERYIPLLVFQISFQEAQWVLHSPFHAASSFFAGFLFVLLLILSSHFTLRDPVSLWERERVETDSLTATHYNGLKAPR